MTDKIEFVDGAIAADTLSNAAEWRCYRCKTVLPSPHDGVPPIACLKELGGCCRTSEDCGHETPQDDCDICKAGYTRWFPASWSDAKVQLHIDAELDPGLDELIAHLKTVIHFRRDEDYVLMILWASQGWLGPTILPRECLAYAAFVGPKSSGKTTATRIATDIAGGRMLAGGTEAAIRAILDGDASGVTPRALGIDEIDIRMKATPDLEGIFRVGNRWDAEYPIRVPKAGSKGWDTRMLKIGGPKVFNYRTDPEDALASRTLVIEMKPYSDVGMIVRGLFDSPAIDKVRQVLNRRAIAAAAKWSPGKLEEHMTSASFLARVEKLNANLPRGKQLGAVLLGVADLMRFNAEAVIAQAIAEEREDSLQAYREILSEIHDEHEDESKDGVVRLKNSDVHAWLNTRLKDRQLLPVSPREWARLRREFSIDTIKWAHGRMLLFGPATRKALGVSAG
jgi:hypothetical protein